MCSATRPYCTLPSRYRESRQGSPGARDRHPPSRARTRRRAYRRLVASTAAGSRTTGHRRLAMFAQVIQGTTSQPDALRSAMDRWTRELGPAAVGWLGSTGGVNDDGRSSACSRFESAGAAARNSDRPEQTRWWEDTQRLFDGEVTFHDSEDVNADVR